MGHIAYDGTAGNTASVPDSAALDITGDIDIRWRFQLNTVQAAQRLILKGNMWIIQLHSTLGVGMLWKETGPTDMSKYVGVTNSDWQELGWWRVTFDVDNGASGHTVTVYKSTDGTNWVYENAGTTAGVTDIVADTSVLHMGGHPSAELIDGDLYNIQVYDGIDGTLVLDVDFTDLTPAEVTAGSFTEDSSNAATVTLNGTDWSYVRPLGFNTTLRNNSLDEIAALAGTSAQIILYNGTQPATGGTVTTEVATLVGNATAFAPAASGGVLTVNAVTADESATGGTATWGRINTSGGATHVCDFTVGTTGDMVLTNNVIVAGSSVGISSFVITDGNP